MLRIAREFVRYFSTFITWISGLTELRGQTSSTIAKLNLSGGPEGLTRFELAKGAGNRGDLWHRRRVEVPRDFHGYPHSVALPVRSALVLASGLLKFEGGLISLPSLLLLLQLLLIL